MLGWLDSLTRRQAYFEDLLLVFREAYPSPPLSMFKSPFLPPNGQAVTPFRQTQEPILSKLFNFYCVSTCHSLSLTLFECCFIAYLVAGVYKIAMAYSFPLGIIINELGKAIYTTPLYNSLLWWRSRMTLKDRRYGEIAVNEVLQTE